MGLRPVCPYSPLSVSMAALLVQTSPDIIFTAANIPLQPRQAACYGPALSTDMTLHTLS